MKCGKLPSERERCVQSAIVSEVLLYLSSTVVLGGGGAVMCHCVRSSSVFKLHSILFVWGGGGGGGGGQ